MKSLLQSLFVFVLYIAFLFIEGFVGFFDFGGVTTQASSLVDDRITLRSVELLTPLAAYELEGFDTIVVRVEVSNEIPHRLFRMDCSGDLDIRSVQVDRGIEYEVEYRPHEYCQNLKLFVHDVEIFSHDWDRW